MHSGKTTCADHLISTHNFKPYKFATPLKNMLRCLGMGDDEIERSDKDRPYDLLCGKTPRYAMQTLGTDWGRNMIGDDFWCNIWKARVLGLHAVTNDDCRFPNEAKAVHDLGGIVIRVYRPGCGPSNHPSELEIASIQPDYEIENTSTKVDLYAKLELLLKELAS